MDSQAVDDVVAHHDLPSDTLGKGLTMGLGRTDHTLHLVLHAQCSLSMCQGLIRPLNPVTLAAIQELCCNADAPGTHPSHARLKEQ